MPGSNGAPTLTAPQPSTQPAHRAGRPVMTSPSGRPRRRRRGLVLAGAAAMVAGAWLSAFVYMSADDRIEAVALANNVEAYEALERSDLATVRVPEVDGVDIVEASEIDDIIGRVVRADQPADSLLVEADLFGADEPLVDSTEAVVGARLSEGTVPVELSRGREVIVVIRPTQSARSAEGSDSAARSVDGWILTADEVDTVAGRPAGVAVSVVVPRDVATEVADAAADDRLSIVALEE